MTLESKPIFEAVIFVNEYLRWMNGVLNLVDEYLR
jgi:hypothetical protein